MPDDEPLDDARAVGIAAAAATAKVIETAARAAADRGYGPRPDPAAAERRLDELAAAERWAASQNPDRPQHYYTERDGALRSSRVDVDRLRGAETSLVEDWRHTTSPEQETREAGVSEAGQKATKDAAPAYDSAERRTSTDSAMKAAGVDDEPRKARTTSDLLNGADPLTAAAAGKTAKPAAAPTKPRSPEQARTR